MEIIIGIQKEEKLHQKKLNEGENKVYLNALIKNIVEMWKKLIKKVIHRDYNMPLTTKELCNPSHEIVCTLLYIYSMETFLVYGLNTATREKNPDKIATFGPLAMALWCILLRAEDRRPKEVGTVGRGYDYTSVFRGLKLK